ncbi:MAG: ATP synthase subunit I [Deltaproteobacteria bacterium]|nr:ATP synthase subunit I [Deltaproteobacteria bacterium]
MTVDVTLWALAFLWGAALGLFYFGGLWLTLKTMVRERQPKRRLLISYAVRLTGALAGFWLVVRKDPVAFLFTLLAFFLIRIILTRILGRKNGGEHHAAHP